MKNILEKLNSEKGDLTEELIILPIKIFIFVAIFELSCLLINYYIFVEAYGTALRQAEIQGGVNDVVVTATKNHLKSLISSIDVNEVTVTGDPGPVDYGKPIYVEMSYTYKYKIIDPALQLIKYEMQFNPAGYTTSSRVNHL